ncbi:hypothetical protein DSLASN_35480 [Desulfoluna limicola]|uniref:Uncharacterized protein n=1 Tax=Desulfoluna limicola TaxID=2810562 RepID=A0ABM7PLF7_9BACT|nr:hypothetical protein DSLASN_35480 [Desulfoluna limicola]
MIFLATGVIPVNVNREKALQPVSSCTHGSPVSRSANTTVERTVEAYLTCKAIRTAGEDDIGALSLRNK